VGRRALVVACACGLLLLAPSGQARTTLTALTPGERAVLAEINRFRAAHGLRAFRVDPRLQRAAKAHSQYMLAHGYFGHGDVSRRLQSYGVRGATGEVVAWRIGSGAPPQAVVAEWAASPPHRANLLSRRFRRVGVGLAAGALGGQPAFFVAVDFST
jgi:uncharacterized protein YkwD